jgi:hypothetical protein
MEGKMSDEQVFAERAAQIARANLEEQLIQSSRQYEDALRGGDEYSASSALQEYAETKQKYDLITGSGQQQQGQLSNAQRNFLSRRQAGGDTLNAERMQVYSRGHDRAIQGGLRPDSPEHFRAIEWYADHQGDGRTPP